MIHVKLQYSVKFKNMRNISSMKLTASCNCSLILLTGVDGSIPWAFNRAANKAALLISVVDDGIVVVKPRPVRIALKKDSSS